MGSATCTTAEHWMIGGAEVLADGGEDVGPHYRVIADVAAMLGKHGPAAVLEAMRDAAACGADALSEAADTKGGTSREAHAHETLRMAAGLLARASEAVSK